MKRLEALVPEGFTVDEFLVKLGKYQEVLLRRFEAPFAQVSRDVGAGGAMEKNNYLQLLVDRDAPLLQAEIFAALGFGDDVLTGCLQKFQTNERVMRMVQEFSGVMQATQLKYFGGM